MNELQNNSNFSGPATARLEIPRLNFGQRLKQARLEKELSLAETARRTKISQTAIMDLESGDFNVITLAPHYCRCIIEKLCIAYDCQHNEIQDAFDLDLHDFNVANNRENVVEFPFSVEEELNSPRPLRLSALLITVLVFFLLLLVLCGWIYHRYQRSTTMEAGIKYDLPSLIELPSLPDTPLPLPTN